MTETERTTFIRYNLTRVDHIAPVQGWHLAFHTSRDSDGFDYREYAAVRGSELRWLDVSRFRFTPSHDRFAWLVNSGFPQRPSFGPWDDTDIEMRMAITEIAA